MYFVHFCRCYTCGGSGLLECEVCDTNGQLKCFIKLTVTWTTHKNDHVVERTALPDQLIRGAQGQQAFSDQRQRVIPVMTFPDRAVNEASQQLIHAHSISFHNEMILMQVCMIPCVLVHSVKILSNTNVSFLSTYNTLRFTLLSLSLSLSSHTYYTCTYII